MLNHNFLAPAKLNLFLRVLKKTPTNYHLLQSFVIFINLYDQLIFKSSIETSLQINGLFKKHVPSNNSNLILKIVDYLKHNYNITKNIHIELTKNIPIGAGLGGGSSDAAITLQALNKIWQLNLPLLELINIGAKIGADVPICLQQNSGIMEGIGEKFTDYKLPFVLPILLVKPNIALNTGEVFKALNSSIEQAEIIIPHDFTLNKDDFLNFIKQQNNDLTTPAISICKEVSNLLDLLQQTNPVIARMTGSGSSCFAIYNSQNELEQAKNFIESLHPSYFIFAGNNLP